MLEQDENETARGDKRNSTADYGNDKVNSLFDKFPQIAK